MEVIDRLTRKSMIEGQCSLWKGARHDRDGWGLIKVDGKVKRVHRVAWEIKNGPIPFEDRLRPDGSKVRYTRHLHHTCANRNCWNVEHLVLGDEWVSTYAPTEKVTEPEVSTIEVEDETEEMKALYHEGRSLRFLADEFDMSVHEVRALAKNWGRVRGAAH